MPETKPLERLDEALRKMRKNSSEPKRKLSRLDEKHREEWHRHKQYGRTK